MTNHNIHNSEHWIIARTNSENKLPKTKLTNSCLGIEGGQLLLRKLQLLLVIVPLTDSFSYAKKYSTHSTWTWSLNHVP